MRTFVNGFELPVGLEEIPEIYDKFWFGYNAGPVSVIQLVRVHATDYYPWSNKLYIRVEAYEGMHENGMPKVYLQYPEES